MKGAKRVKELLVTKFDSRHIESSLKHYSSAVEKFALRDWDGVEFKAGKFVESITKALMVLCSKPIGAARKFRAGNELRQLEGATAFPDVVRIVIPKACIFVYEIVNNRGGRHDAHDIDANEMDTNTIVPIISWVLAEMVRFCSTDADTATAAALIEELTNKTYPYFETVDGRSYVNIRDLRGGEIALLLLYFLYPERLGRQELVDAVARHGVDPAAAKTAVHRLKHLVDDDSGAWKLRGIGRQEADQLLKSRLSGKVAPDS